MPSYTSGYRPASRQRTDELDLLRSALKEGAERIEDEHGYRTAQSFYEMATGATTPLLHYVNAWLAEGGVKGPLKARTQRQYRRDLDQLHSWLCFGMQI